MSDAARLVRYGGGVPVYDYRTDLITPPVSVVRSDDRHPPPERPHIHDFPVLVYFHSVGAVYVVAPGQVIDPGGGHVTDGSVGVFFDPAALGGAGRAPWPAWRAHQLLFPFLHDRSDGLLRVEVPPARRPLWDGAIAAMESELAQRQEGYCQAVLAHLTLLLIDLARMAADVVGDLRHSGEPLLAEVFEVIDKLHTEPLSLRDVAHAVGMTPGHLTTVVRRRTGRTVQEWITRRRMVEARQLLTTTDLPVGEVARRVGISDPGYFTRTFRRHHGMPPRQWRDRLGPPSVRP